MGNSLVCVTKSTGALRLCLDPKDLNQAIKRPHYFTPTLEDVLPKLNGAKCFSILDARSGYWNIKLDQESSLYTTFNSPFVRYRFLRLPFGLICAQDVFQRKVGETFGDLPGVTGIADDIVVHGYNSDFSDHDENLRAVLQRARETGLRFNLDKCKFRCTRIPFFGHIVGAEGLQPDPRKIDSILSMDPSSSLTDLQTFLGMVQFLSRFIPNLATAAADLWGLTEKTSEFIWSPEHQSAVDRIKQLITAPKALRYFNSAQPVTIQVDASQRGLGAVLLQDNGPVEFASKLLSETESRYSNIEREMLAADHKPLEAIFKKHLASAPPRIARMMLRIQRYDAQIKYVPGKDIPIANALSRISSCHDEAVQGLDVSVHEIYQNLNASPTRVGQIQEKTAEDPILSALREVIMGGWPEKRSDCPAHLHAYWNYRDELTVADGLILKGTRIIIPKSLQPDVLQQLHYAHQGAEKCKLRAKGSVFWANINKDIDEMVKSCPPCQRHQKLNAKEPLLPHDVPQKAWHTLCSDLFFWNNTYYLLVTDYYGKFPVVKKLANTQSPTVIAHLKSIFEEHGIPSKLVTDNGPQYASAAFHEFSRGYGFTHVTSSPLYPQSNGLIERTVQTVKDLLQKRKESGQDPHMAMLCLRSTPLSHDLPSPVELLNGRVYQTNLPAVSKPSFSANGDTNAKLQVRQDKQKEQYDKTAKQPLRPLFPEDRVRILNPSSNIWEPGIVQHVADSPRSHLVATEKGGVLRRNRRHLRRTGESFQFSHGEVPEDIPVADSTLQAADHKECGSSSDSVSPESAAYSSAEPESVSPSSTADPTPAPLLRRSSRRVKAPEKLNL